MEKVGRDSAVPVRYNPMPHQPGLLFIQVLHNPQPVGGRRTAGEKLPADSYLLCVDPATGKDLWRQIRPSDAVRESLEAYSTPIPYQTADRKEVLVAGADFITGHNLETGAETWRIGGYHPERSDTFRLVPTPVLADDLVVICEPRANNPVRAFRAGRNSPERTTVPVWLSRDAGSEVAVPLYYDKKLFIIDGDYKKEVNCLDAATGKPVWNYKTNSRPLIRSSPTGADGKVYFLNEEGDVWVLAAADGKELFHGKLESGKGARASVVALAGQVLVRTSDRLYLFKV
jgi:outer membrane protein assembly factor BamB